MQPTVESDQLDTRSAIKKNLPYLNAERLEQIFAGVYNAPAPAAGEAAQTGDERIRDLANALYALQRFNYRHRRDDTLRLFSLFAPRFNFERNTDGPVLWLALALAIQELYGLSDSKLVEVIGQLATRE